VYDACVYDACGYGGLLGGGVCMGAEEAPDGHAAYTLRPPSSSLLWPPPPPITKDTQQISQMLDQLGLLHDPQPVRGPSLPAFARFITLALALPLPLTLTLALGSGLALTLTLPQSPTDELLGVWRCFRSRLQASGFH